MGKERVFYVYVDWTTEEVPRVFYVGKGNEKRVKVTKRRNAVWNRIRNKYGFNRTIIMVTKDENYAFEVEVELIRKYKTFIGNKSDRTGWGANLTKGGEGASGRQISEKMKERLKINGPAHHMFGFKHTKESIAKMSGPNNPNYGKPNWNSGISPTKESIDRQKATVAANGHWAKGLKGSAHPIYGKKHKPEAILNMIGINAGAKNKMSKLNDEKVIQILDMIKYGSSDKNIGQIYNVNSCTIYDIRKDRSWKHIKRSSD